MKYKYKYYFVENPTGSDFDAMKKIFDQMPVAINIYSAPKYHFKLERYVYGVIMSTYLLSIETMARFNLASDPMNYLRHTLRKDVMKD